MKKLFLGFMFVLAITQLFAQELSDTIQIRKSAGISYFQNGKHLSMRNLLDITQSDDAAHSEMLVAKNYSNSSKFFSFTGGFLIGFSIGNYLAERKTTWKLAAAGAGLIVLSFPFQLACNKHIFNAVDYYNLGIRQSAIRKVEYQFGLSCDRIGLKVKF